MTPAEWTGLVVAAVAATLAWIGFRGGRMHQWSKLRFVCPVFDKPVDCQIGQDMRTGQWNQVVACSAFDKGDVSCGQECAKLMNLGLLVPETRST